MKKVMKRICTAALLAIVSTAAMADEIIQRVILEESYTGGTITAAQGETAEDGSVAVTLTVTPSAGYYIRKGDILVQLGAVPDMRVLWERKWCLVLRTRPMPTWRTSHSHVTIRSQFLVDSTHG